MSEQTQTCKRCGAAKPLSQFRKYYGNRKGHYTFCLECEKLETRRKYLKSKTSLTDYEQHELESIEKLYAMRMKRGLKVPCQRDSSMDVLSIVERHLAEMQSDEDL
jgi:hypothetical protein